MILRVFIFPLMNQGACTYSASRFNAVHHDKR